jgi:hypothetical protein
MFTQCVVVFATLFIVATLSDITIHQEGHQHECINLSCPKGAFNDIDHPLIKENSKEQKCTICTQCTNFGYSVCAQPLSKALRFRRELDEDHCACANFVPETCKISQISSANKKDPNNRIFKICYLSTLRTPPKVYGLNQEKDFIVTIEQFWLEPYWRDFELSNLTLFYKFEVKSPEHCDEIGKVTTINDSSTPLHICTSSLPIEMNGENIPTDTSEAGKKSYDPTDFFSQNDDQYDEDENTPPEVEFGRDVFVGAKFVDIWYTVTVKRPHQLSFGERPFHDVTTVISSESLKHNLEPEVFGNGMGANNDASNDDDDKKVPMSKETKAGHDSVSKVNIQTEKDDDEDDEEEDKEDPIPSDNPGITDDSDEETEEGDDADKDDKTEKDGDDEGEDVEETEETEETEATEEPEETDKDDEEKTDKSEKETNASDEEVEDEETTTIAAGEETTEAPTEENQESDETTTILDDDMASVNETQSFFEQHFSNWPTMRVVFALVAIASIILIAAACCYRYRGCCCYSDQQKVVTKTSNGYEYHVTGQQTGQEMVGPPETQKLTQ